MRITDLNIDRFGVWRDLRLPIAAQGVTVFYGPNEAGKSTLMRFLRGMLYGYRPQDERTPGPNGKPMTCSGGLRLDHNRQEYRLRRISEAGTRGRLTVDGAGGDAAALLHEVTRGASEEVFENVFAIGLSELQELATLDGEEVARHIYGISLGPDGERILQAHSSLERERSRLLASDGKQGDIVDLARRLEHFHRELGQVGDVSTKHFGLVSRRGELQQGIDDVKRQQSRVQQELRGRQFLERIWKPWMRHRQLKAELRGLPTFSGIPADGLSRLDGLETQLETQLRRKRKVYDDARQIQEKIESFTTSPQFEEQVCAVRGLLERQPSIREIERGLRDRDAQVDRLQRQLEDRLNKLDQGWSTHLLESADTSSATLSKLLDKAQRYRSASHKRARAIRRYKAFQGQSQRRRAFLSDQVRLFGLAPLPGRDRAVNRDTLPLATGAVDEAMAHARRRLVELEELVRLRQQETILAQTAAAIEEQIRDASRPKELPQFFYGVLWFFGVAGAVLFLAGLYGLFNGLIVQGAENAVWFVGVIYMLLGACAGGVTWTMKEHFEPQQQDHVALRARLTSTENELNETLRGIDRITRSEAGPAQGGLGVYQESVGETDLILLARRRIADLEAFSRDHERHRHLRRKLGEMRDRLKDRQQELAATRREWCDFLKQLGFRETLSVRDALATWQVVGEAREQWTAWQTSDREVSRDRKTVADFHVAVETLAARIDGPQPTAIDPHARLVDWEQRLKRLDESRTERIRLRQALRDRKKEAAALDEKIADLKSQRLTLLSQAGVANRDELAARIKSLGRVTELQREIDEVQTELESASRAEPELAIVEEDLLDFDPHRNEQALDALRRQLKELDAEMQGAYERLGRAKQEILELEGDRRVSTLRYDRQQIAADLQESVERWCAAHLAQQAVDKIRTRVERSCQPSTLKHASEYLARLTCGKYHNIWTPLGERHLAVDDDQGQSLRIEHLSSGTREQLFLAVRLAMIREFSDHGTELPMILDDVVVNFDQSRTEAAVNTLMDFAEDGQQILMFTCHLHLAQLFESKGIEPIWLPGRSVIEERQAG